MSVVQVSTHQILQFTEGKNVLFQLEKQRCDVDVMTKNLINTRVEPRHSHAKLRKADALGRCHRIFSRWLLG